MTDLAVEKPIFGESYTPSQEELFEFENTFNMADFFLNKGNNGALSVGVIGMGYVGMPLAEAFVHAGTPVVGFEVSESRAEDLNMGRSYLGHIDDERIQTMIASNIFSATTDMTRLSEADAILICVPTPLDKYHSPDLSYAVSYTHLTLPTICSV